MTTRGLLFSVATTTLFGAMTMSCSDPVPPTKEGAFVVHLNNSNPMCGLAQHNIAVPDAWAPKSGLVSDGGAVKVECRVKQNGNSFDFSGQVKDANATIVFSVSGTATPGMDDATAAASVSSTETSQNPFGGSNCTLSVTKTDAAPGLGVSPGTIAGSITCPTVTQPGTNPMKVCALTDFDATHAGGYFEFKNCEQ